MVYVFVSVGILTSTKPHLQAVMFSARSSGDGAYSFPGWYKEHKAKPITWKIQGTPGLLCCWCVPRGCQGEVPNPGCAQRGTYPRAAQLELASPRDASSFSGYQAAWWERKTWVWRRRLVLAQVPHGESHLTLVGFPCVSRERRGIREPLFLPLTCSTKKHSSLTCSLVLERAFIIFFFFLFPWKLCVFFKRIDFFIDGHWEACSSAGVGWTWNCCCYSFNFVFLLLEIYF